MRQRPVVEVLEYALGQQPSEEFVRASGNSINRFFVGLWNRFLFGPSQFNKNNKRSNDNEQDKSLEWAFALGLSAFFADGALPRDYLKERLALALQKYREATRDKLLERAPEQWVKVQTNLGKALYDIGVIYNDFEFIRRSEPHLRAAVESSTNLEQRSVTLGLLGCVLHFWGGRQDSDEYLNQATIAYREALQILPKSEQNFQRASLLINLGMALQLSGIREHSYALFREAASSLTLALRELPELSRPDLGAGAKPREIYFSSVLMRHNAFSKLAGVLLADGLGSRREAIETYRKAIAELQKLELSRDRRSELPPLTDDEILELFKNDFSRNYIPRLWEPLDES